MNTYFDSYSQLSHLRFGQKIDINLERNKVTNFFKNEDVRGRTFIIADQDPLRLALTFLYLIDHKAVPIPAHPGYPVISETSYVENLSWKKKDLQRNIGEEINSYICLSSGTTGQPKTLRFSFEKALINAKSHAEGFGINPKEVIVQTLPIYHSYGIIAFILTPLVVAVPVDFCPGIVGLRSFKSSAHRILHISPSQARFILKDKFENIQGISKITIGGGAMHSKEMQMLQAKFPGVQFYLSYGLTEAGPRVTAGEWTNTVIRHSISLDKAWIGRALPGVQLGILDNQKVLPDGTGTLCIKSPSQCINLQNSQIIDGWLVTRDQVSISEQNVYFLSRADDIIKCGGITLYPGEMENQFRSLPNVDDVLILKKIDPIYDEVPILFIEGAIEKSAVEAFISENISPGLIPREIHILKEFPRQSLNKVDRNRLRQMTGMSYT